MSAIRPIDRFVGALHRDQGSELVLETGRSVRVRTPSGERTILAQEVRTDQIENLVREVTPPDCARIFEDAGEVSFPYTAPTGAVMIHLLRRDRKLCVTVRPYAAAQRRAAPPPPTARPAEPMVMESALDSVMSAARPMVAGVAVTGVHVGGPALGRIAPVTTAAVRPRASAIQADLAAYVESAEHKPMELALESFAPPPDLVAQAESEIARRAGVRAAPQVEVRGVSPGEVRGVPVGHAAITYRAPGPIMREAAPVMREATPATRDAAPIALRGATVAARNDGPIILRELSEPAPAAREVAVAPPLPRDNAIMTMPMGRDHVRVSVHPTAAVAIVAEPPAAPAAPPIVRLVPSPTGDPHIDPILRALVANKGSDLHLTARLAPLFRKDGDIGPVPGFTDVLDSDTIFGWLMEIAPPLSREKFAAKNDADFAYEIAGVARFRVNVFRDRRGVGGVLRVIPSQILTADQLKLPPVVRDLCHLEKGLVVVTGPTGSGKSTTLAAMIDLINKTRADHVITIEDPVEFVHEPQRCLVNQREIHSHTESFSAALRAALREDPDIVLVGEMRDLETVSIAIETAETGHLVFGTLHTNTAVSTVDRIIDQFPTDRQAQVRVMLSESLKGVIAQTLCKKIGGGRAAALEILVSVPAVANMIREGKTFQLPSIMQTGKNVGMVQLNDSLMGLVREGTIEPGEAFRRAVARTEMKSALERAGYKLD